MVYLGNFAYSFILLLALLPNGLQARNELVKKTIHTTYHSFILVDNLIVVQAEVSGEVGNYILDTGSSGLVLNSVHNSRNNHKALVEIMGSTSSLKTHQAKVNNFKFGTITKKNFIAASISLLHIEEAMDMKINGLLGMGLLKDTEIFIDFDARLIILNDEKIKSNEKGIKLKLDYIDNIPIIVSEMHGLELNLALDLGATCSVMDKSIADALGLEVMDKVDLLSVNGKSEALDKVKCSDLLVGKKLIFQTEAVVSNLSHLSYGSKVIHGILGMDLLKSAKIMIDPNKSELRIWPQDAYN